MWLQGELKTSQANAAELSDSLANTEQSLAETQAALEEKYQAYVKLQLQMEAELAAAAITIGELTTELKQTADTLSDKEHE